MEAANDNSPWDFIDIDDEVLPVPHEDWGGGDAGGVQIVGPTGPEQRAA